MADLESVIAGSLSDAGIGESADSGDSTPDTSEDISTDTSEGESSETPATEEVGSDTGDDTSPDISGEEPAPEPTPAPVEKDQLTKDLEELGLKAPKEGERENRLPHSRVKKIAENYGKKVEARFTQEVTTLKAENHRLSRVAETVRNIDHLINTDPDRYMAMLSTIHPGKFDKYMGQARNAPAAAPGKAKADSAIGPRPQPDVTFEDKTRGYSPEQHDKLLEWIKADAKEEAKREMQEWVEEKYGPIAKSFEARQALNEQIPIVKQTVQNVYDTWGKELVEKHEDEIVQLMQQYPEMPTQEAVARILVPKVRADRNSIRNDVIREQKSRTAAAAKVVPGGIGAGKESNEPKSIEDVIRRSIAGLKR